MSDTLAKVQSLVAKGEVQMSHHAMLRLDEQDIYPPEVRAGVASAIVVEDYPLLSRGACVLVLQREGRWYADPLPVGHPAIDGESGRFDHRLPSGPRPMVA